MLLKKRQTKCFMWDFWACQRRATKAECSEQSNFRIRPTDSAARFKTARLPSWRTSEWTPRIRATVLPWPQRRRSQTRPLPYMHRNRFREDHWMTEKPDDLQWGAPEVDVAQIKLELSSIESVATTEQTQTVPRWNIPWRPKSDTEEDSQEKFLWLSSRRWSVRSHLTESRTEKRRCHFPRWWSERRYLVEGRAEKCHHHSSQRRWKRRQVTIHLGDHGLMNEREVEIYP